MLEIRLRSALHPTRFLTLAVLTVALLSTPSYGTVSEVRVTDQPYIRHDGGTDTAIQNCSSSAPTGGGHRQQNEPTVAINPSARQVIVAGANDYCTVPTFRDAWMGFYVSGDGGQTWLNSLNPGYPADTSAAGRASPIFGVDTSSGDPVMAWDNANRLFYGGIAFNRTATNESEFVTPTNGNFIVSTWQHDPSSPLGMRYLRTVIVGPGTPAGFFKGRFNDKDSLKVDTWTTSPNLGNVYATWTLFPGSGQDQILFSRSTNHGQTFSTPIKISKGVASAQGSAIAVAPDGTVYVMWRQFAARQAGLDNAIIFVKSTDGGRTFSDPRTFATVPVPYDRSDLSDAGAPVRDCGDGPFHCQSNYTFHRTTTFPEAVVDTAGVVSVTWEQVIPAATPDSTTYQPKGQSQVVFTKSTDGGASWQAISFIDQQSVGHQWWPNIAYDKSTNTLALIYYDSRTDTAFDPNRPPGNNADGTSTCGTSPSPPPDTCNVLNTFIATSTDGGASWTRQQVSTTGHQPEYEMFGGRRVPFHGDYLFIDAAAGTIFGVWTDNRDVVPGTDPRDVDPDGFDVLQCRTSATAPDTCPNTGGLNQNIFGAKLP